MTNPIRTATLESSRAARQQGCLSPHYPTLSAVNYLNMLPFFFDAAHVQLFSSPQELNQSGLNEGAFCSSLIAGIKAKNHLLTTRFGVFSSRAVMTVFVEPNLKHEGHLNFWMQLEELWHHSNTAPLTTLLQTESHGAVVLRSAGESAQSVWMFEALAALAGFKVILLKPHDAPVMNASGKPLPEVNLYIGDKALLRRRQFPELYRLDLGELWASHTKTKPWFAGWFSTGPQNESETQKVEHFLDAQLRKWDELSEFSRWCKCLELLEHQFPDLTSQWSTEEKFELREELSEYFMTLDHTVEPEQGKTLFEFYSKMDEALTQWKNRNQSQPKLSTSSLSSECHSAHSDKT